MGRNRKWKIGFSWIYNSPFFWKVPLYENGRLYYKYRILWLVIEREI